MGPGERPVSNYTQVHIFREAWDGQGRQGVVVGFRGIISMRIS